MRENWSTDRSGQSSWIQPRKWNVIVSILSLISVLGIVTADRVDAADELVWYSSSRDLVEGETVSGFKRVTLETNFRYSGRYIVQWCIYLDDQGLVTSGNDFSTTPSYLYYELGVVTRGTGSQTSPGCWSNLGTDRSFGIDLTLNTTRWTNGNRTIKIQATTNGGGVLSKTVTVNTQNSSQSVEWVTNTPANFADTVALRARINPVTNHVVKACLTRDGIPVGYSEQTSFTGDSLYGGSWNGPRGTFGRSSAGCFEFTEAQNNRYPNGLWQTTTLDISLRTSTWESIPTALTLSITDADGNSTSASLEFHSLTPTPRVSVTDEAESILRERSSLNLAYLTSGSTVSSFCATVDGAPLTTLDPTGCLSNSRAQSLLAAASLNIDTTMYANGSHVLSIIVTDRVGRSSTSDFRFRVDNQAPLLAPAGFVANRPLTGIVEIQANASIDPRMKSARLVDSCIAGISASEICGKQPLVVNTACLKNGPADIQISAVDTFGFRTTDDFSLIIENTKPTMQRTTFKATKPSWTSKSVSGSMTMSSIGACKYSIVLKAPRVKTRTLRGNVDSNNMAVAITGLVASKTYVATITLNSESGKSSRVVRFTTPKIPPRPSSAGRGSSGVGGSVRNFVWWQLNEALSVGGFRYTYQQEGGCRAYGNYEHGLMGVWDTSNWVVVRQRGYTLYVCKRR